MAETKRCEQCYAEKDIELFGQAKNVYTALHRMSICKDCYRGNRGLTLDQIETLKEQYWGNG